MSRPIESQKINALFHEELSNEMKRKILHGYHKILGHGSAGKMRFMIKDTYNWPGIGNEIEDIVKNVQYVIGQGKH